MTATRGDQPSATAESGRRPSLTVFHVGVLVAVAHLGVLAVRPGLGLAALAAVEAGVCLGLGAVEFWETREPVQSLGLVLTAGALLAGLLLGVWLGIARWLLAAGLLGVAAVLLYGLHRYQLIVLGKVEAGDEH